MFIDGDFDTSLPRLFCPIASCLDHFPLSLTNMAPKEPTRQQLSSRLAYSATTPKFLQKLHNRIAGINEDDEDEDDEFEDDGSGRPPIPRRPAIPERPDDDPGSADEDGGDEKPQVVVLKEGKHLTEREAENIKRTGEVMSGFGMINWYLKSR